jgi:radical SAM protein with 4Fe4S-binding SPASM domain
MKLDDLQKIGHDLFPALKLCRIGGNNLGEQLCFKRWNESLELLGNYRFTPWLITNGHLLTPDRIRKLVENEFTIDISIDAASEEKYSRIRGASLKKLIGNVRALSRERERQNKMKCKIAFSFTAFRDNISELPDLLNLAAEIGVNQITAIHFMPTTEEQRYQSLFYHQTTANEVFSKAKQLSERLGIRLLLPSLYTVKELSSNGEVPKISVEGNASSGRKGKTQCFHPWTSVSISERGEVYPCCQSNTLMGSFENSTFREIWNNRRYQKLRKTVNSANPPKYCRDCALRGNTLTGIDCGSNEYFLRNINMNGYFKSGYQTYLNIKVFLNENRFTRRIYPTLRNLYKKIQ